MSLPDLSKAVAEQFAAIVESGAIQTMIEKHLSDSISTILKEQLRTYSDFGKALESKVKAALTVEDLRDLPNYGHFLSSIIAKNVDQQLHGAYAVKLAEDVATLFKDAPAEITLDAFIDLFKQHARDNPVRDLGYRITLHLKEWDSGGFVVHMDEDEDKRQHDCDLQFQVTSAGKIFALKFKDSDVAKNLFIGGMDNFERALFRMYVQGTTFRIEPGSDRQDFDLSLRDD